MQHSTSKGVQVVAQFRSKAEASPPVALLTQSHRHMVARIVMHTNTLVTLLCTQYDLEHCVVTGTAAG